MTNYLQLESIPNIEREAVGGIARIKNIELREAKTGSIYGNGELKLVNDNSINFKIWDENYSREVLKEFNNNEKGFYANIDATVNLYRGEKQLIISFISTDLNIGIDELKSHFNTVSKEKLDKRNSVFANFKDILQRNTTDECYNVFKSIFSDKQLLTQFTSEKAGKSKHDASFGGLLNHTYKMLEILELVLKQQENQLNLSQRGKDLIFLGLAIHDIGKTQELDDGNYTKESVATHRGLGILILAEHKDAVIESYDNQFLLELVAIINQHHGLYEERPHSVFSYIVHLVDNFEASMSIVSEGINRNVGLGSIKLFDYPELRIDSDYFEQ